MVLAAIQKKTLIVGALLVFIAASAFLAFRPSTPEHEAPPQVGNKAVQEAQADGSTRERRNNPSSPEATDVESKSDYNSDVLLALGGAPREEKCALMDRIILRDDGSQISAKECVYETEQPRHPYDDYSSETLSEMSYGDPYAALVLAKRVREKKPELAWTLFVRAAALLQDGTPLVWLATTSYSGVATNDVPEVQDIELYYILSSIANRLPAGPSQPYVRFRGQPYYVMTDEDLRRLEDVVDRYLEQMEKIRLEVTGSAE